MENHSPPIYRQSQCVHLRTGNVAVIDKASASKRTRIFGEAFQLDQLAHSLVLAGTQLALDRTDVRGLDALSDSEEPIVAQYGSVRSEGR